MRLQGGGMQFLRTFPPDGTFAGPEKFGFPTLGALTKKKKKKKIRSSREICYALHQNTQDEILEKKKRGIFL